MLIIQFVSVINFCKEGVPYIYKGALISHENEDTEPSLQNYTVTVEMWTQGAPFLT